MISIHRSCIYSNSDIYVSVVWIKMSCQVDLPCRTPFLFSIVHLFNEIREKPLTFQTNSKRTTKNDETSGLKCRVPGPWCLASNLCCMVVGQTML